MRAVEAVVAPDPHRLHRLAYLRRLHLLVAEWKAAPF